MFNKKETEEEKKARKHAEEMERLKDRYHLGALSREDYEAIVQITSDFAGNSWFLDSKNGTYRGGETLSFPKVEDQAIITYLSTIVEQNWLLFSKLDEISKKLDKIH